jgi:ABC-type lipoprotein export system ATPase subunit
MSRAVSIREAFRIHRSRAGTAVALQGLSLDVAEGEIVVVLGPSGSGKTTLLRVIAGFEPLSAGRVEVLGTDIGRLSGGGLARFRSRHLGLLDQHYARALSPDLTALDSVKLGLALLGVPAPAARSRALELLRRVGLADRAGALPGELSGGEQQRVALCASLAHAPTLLLTDEPAGELDAGNATVVYSLIGELARERGATAVVVSHDDAAASIADRLVHVRDGRVVEESRAGGARALVVTEPGWIRLPEPALEALGDARRLTVRIDEAGVVVTSAERSRRAPVAAAVAPAEADGSFSAEVRDVVKRYEGAPRAVLDGISDRFHRGTVTALVGRSGSGKTTLLHLLAGLDEPTAGVVLVNGQELGSLDRAEVAAVRRRHVGLVTQEPGLVPHLTALENVELGLHVRGVADDHRERALRALGQVALGHRLHHRADRLSAGERQRVAIARAVAGAPALLLADEPTARLDEANARAVAKLLADLAHTTQTAVVCATHDDTLIEHAGRILELEQADAMTLVPRVPRSGGASRGS